MPRIWTVWRLVLSFCSVTSSCRWATAVKRWTWSLQPCNSPPRSPMFTFNSGPLPFWKASFFFCFSFFLLESWINKIYDLKKNADLYRMCGDGGREAEAYQTHNNFTQLLMKDNYASHQCAEHALITWIEQPLASFLQLGNVATASTSSSGSSGLPVPSTSNMIAMPTASGSSSIM